MKLGNVSQSIVPVPKYFLNNKSIDLIYPYNQTEANFNSKKIFKKKGRVNKSYFRTRDLLSLNLDFNVNKNPRTNNYRATMENTKKYIPIYNTQKLKNNSEIKGTYFPDIIYMNNIKNIPKNIEKEKVKSVIQQYQEYKKSNNIEQKINPDLISDLVHNTENLITKINMDIDFERWKKFDSRTTMNLFFQPAYSPLTDFNQNNKSEKDNFRDTLKNKAMGLTTISNKAKAAIQKSIYENELEKKCDELEEKKRAKKLEILIENSKNNFLKLRFNNTNRPSYNLNDREFIWENKAITNRLNRTKLYKDFPSPIREEFIEKRIYKNKRLFSSRNNKK